MKGLTFVGITVLAGLLCAVPGFIVGKLLVKHGMVYDRSPWLVGGTVVNLLILRMAFAEIPLVWLMAGVTVLMPLGLFRHDLWTYWRNRKLP